MVRGHNLSIDTVAASRGQRTTSKSSLDNNENNSSFDDDDYLTSSPSIIEEEIDFSLVYALHSFQATVEGQATVMKGDSLSLFDDSNSYWWLVKVLPSDEIGYIPAETIETPYERLARLNKHRNISITSAHSVVESDNSLPKQIPTEQSVVQHEKIDDDVQLVNEPEEIKYADKQVINPESDQDNLRGSRGSDNSVKVTESEIVELDVKRTSDQQYEKEINQQHRQENNQQYRQENKQQYSQEKNQQYRHQSQQSDDIRQSSQRSQSYQMKKQTGQLENNLTYDKSAHKIQDAINNKNETIKMSLTPALGSDFIDFSDDEDEGNKMKTRPGGSFEKTGSNSEPTKVNIASSEPIKNVEVSDDKKSGKPKKEEKKKESGGIFRNLFKRKSKKKEEEPVKQVSSAPFPQNNSKVQRPGPLTNQQQQSPQLGSSQNRSSPQIGSLTNRPQHQQAQRASNREHPKVQQVSVSEPPIQVIQRDSGPIQQEILQAPAQDAVQSIKLKNSPSPIRVVQHAPSERSITPLTPLTPFYNVIRIFAGQNISSNEESKLFLLSPTTITSTLIKQALHRFKLDDVEEWENYYITIKEANRDQIHLMSDDLPLEAFHSLTSHNPVTLPSIRRNSVESISSTTSSLSDIDEIKKLGLQNEKGAVTFFLNRRSKRNSRSSEERKLRVRVLVYNDDLPINLRSNKPHIPRTSMSVPKHLAEKAARRRSREEGKPKEKIAVVSGLATVRQVIEKAMEKFEITDGIVDDGKSISDNDEKPRYQLMVIVDGEEKPLPSELNVISVYPTAPKLHHVSVDSIDSSSSLVLDYRPDEPMFVLRLLRPEDLQARAMPVISNIDHKIRTQSRNLNKQDEQKTNNNINTRKQLIEQQREYSREKQKSILSAHKNTSQGIDIVTKTGAIRSSRIFGNKVRYSFIPTKGKEFDISDLVEDIWGDDDDETLNSDEHSDSSFNDSYDDRRNSKKKEFRKSTTQDVDILVKMINQAHNNSGNVVKSFEERIERVLQQVDRYGNGTMSNLATTLRETREQSSQQNSIINHSQKDAPQKDAPILNERSNSLSSGWSVQSPTRSTATTDDFSNDFDDEDNDSVSELYSSRFKNLPSLTIERSQSLESLSLVPQKPRQRSISSASNNSINTNTTIDSITPGNQHSLFRKLSTASSFTDSDWILTDDFGLQELLILVRSGVNMLELKERRRSGWQIHEDPEKILNTLKLTDIRNDIKNIFDNVNNELDHLEQELDKLMDDAIKIF
ncbi:22416_t:CDS:2 [Dentiscutata erythropus]|uniref:22416_t:CDS:1 n=1 Tax=Dentiscutata erythropus TaxID=1348616 RepID=A0A9N9B568_9GLOM|nr:22416_t:CDS:2 [Dentiscutata erythropus]